MTDFCEPLLIQAEHFDDLFMSAVREIDEYPEYICEPRGQKIKETLVSTLVLKNPRARLLNNKARDPQYGFAVGEFLWYWDGRQDLETMLYYNKRMKDFSDDGHTINSAYGHIIKDRKFPVSSFTEDGGPTFHNQWNSCRKTLVDDHDTRRALLIINQPLHNVKAAFRGSKDVPCTLSLQFFIRADKLHLHTNMRSNDAVWGLTYDLFSFTLLQEMMLNELRAGGMEDLELGYYYHTAASLHIYERHFTMAQEVVKEYLSPGYTAAVPMEPIAYREIPLLLKFEEALREGRIPEYDSTQFTGGTRWMAEQLESQRRKRNGK